MSLLHPYEVTCRDGQRRTATLADCLNVQRTPRWRDRVLERTLHRIETSDGPVQVEKAFVYLDLARGQAFLVQPPRDRYRHGDASKQLDTLVRVLPAGMREQAHQLRVVFGVEELREKLVAADAGLDDRAVELMKAALVHDHPVLLARERLRLSLDQVDGGGARFLAQYDHSPKAFHVTYAAPDVFVGQTKALKAWSGTLERNDLYKLPKTGDHWINYRRFLPAQDAVTELHTVTLALAKGKVPKVDGDPFKRMLERLPRGSALSGQAKTDLRKLFTWVKKQGQQQLQDQLFEIRFGIALEDAWYRNADKNDIDTLWRLLKNLPDSHVEGNSRLAEIDLGRGGGGTYSPSTMEIEIGSALLARREDFEDTLRHEVGHAVHENNADLVDGWLWSRFGFAMFPPSAQGVEDWATQMGAGAGWPALSATQKGQVRALLRQALGAGEQWGPTATPSAPVDSPWRGADFGPRLAFERSGNNWYANNTNWYRANGKAFALNFWYGTLMAVDEATLDLVNQKMPDTYAAMSPPEFFAEVYALYYDLGDPQRPNLPKDVGSWIDAKLGKPSKSQPSRGARPASAVARTAGKKAPATKKARA